MKKLIVCLALMLPATQALAQFPMGKVGVSLSPKVDFSVDGAPEDGDGTAMGLHGELGGQVLFGYADLRRSDVDINDVDFDIDENRFGVGVRNGNNTGFFEVLAELYDVELDSDALSEPAEDDGIGMHIGGGIFVTPQANVFARYGILSLDDLDGDEFQFGASGELAHNMEVYGLYRMLSLDDDGTEFEVDELRLGVNLLF